MSAVPRRAAFDDLREGQLVVWLGDDNALGTITGIAATGSRVILDEGAYDIPGVVGSWVILRDVPAPPVQVRREDYDALLAAVDTNVTDPHRAELTFRAANALIDNADLGDT